MILSVRSGWQPVLRHVLLAVVLVVAGLLTVVQGSMSAEAAAAPACKSTRGGFVPSRAYVTKLGWYPVIRVGRDRSGAMGAPSPSGSGLHEFGWYAPAPAAAPGSGRGGVAFTAHTWYGHDATIGNQLLGLGVNRVKGLYPGGHVYVSNAQGTRRTCYRVFARQTLKPSAVPMRRIVVGDGKGQMMSIIVCSGTRSTRNGVVSYSTRTVWFARAVSPA